MIEDLHLYAKLEPFNDADRYADVQNIFNPNIFHVFKFQNIFRVFKLRITVIPMKFI